MTPSRRSRIVRAIWIVVLGIIVTPVASLVGGVVLPGAVAVWVTTLVLYALTSQWSTVGGILAAPLIFGAQWTWPVTCVLLPLLGIVLPRTNASAPLVFLAAGAVAGAVAPYVLIATGMMPWVNPNDTGSFMLSGGIAGAVAGALFGLALWRIDRERPAPSN